eukprot:CAMPEP_0184689152 /NCGR_PEP_ID=MMETSP0312-20130426/30498_1 /TAXON_ID=31354 /ORGANISM="Compsopogon coeruleus, Strain SAG 36.94" /LENGTH=708 /DNA_ID=CAMNT_0027146469 /DNA_START=1296 /DNA_END=3422 /DNA_ORIENTATION=-
MGFVCVSPGLVHSTSISRNRFRGWMCCTRKESTSADYEPVPAVRKRGRPPKEGKMVRKALGGDPAEPNSTLRRRGRPPKDDDKFTRKAGIEETTGSVKRPSLPRQSSSEKETSRGASPEMPARTMDGSLFDLRPSSRGAVDLDDLDFYAEHEKRGTKPSVGEEYENEFESWKPALKSRNRATDTVGIPKRQELVSGLDAPSKHARLARRDAFMDEVDDEDDITENSGFQDADLMDDDVDLESSSDSYFLDDDLNDDLGDSQGDAFDDLDDSPSVQQRGFDDDEDVESPGDDDEGDDEVEETLRRLIPSDDDGASSLFSFLGQDLSGESGPRNSTVRRQRRSPNSYDGAGADEPPVDTVTLDLNEEETAFIRSSVISKLPSRDLKASEYDWSIDSIFADGVDPRGRSRERSKNVKLDQSGSLGREAFDDSEDVDESVELEDGLDSVDEESQAVSLDDYDEGDEEQADERRFGRLSRYELGRVVEYNDDNYVTITEPGAMAYDEEEEEEPELIALRDGQLLRQGLDSNNLTEGSPEWVARRLFELSLTAKAVDMYRWARRGYDPPQEMNALFPDVPPPPEKLPRTTLDSNDVRHEGEYQFGSGLGPHGDDSHISRAGMAQEGGLDAGDVDIRFPCAYTFRAVGSGSEFIRSLREDVEAVLEERIEDDSLLVEQTGKYVRLELTVVVNSRSEITKTYDVIRSNEFVKFSYG